MIQLANPMKNSIRVERARLKMTQAELAEKVKVARQTIIAIEAGKFLPSTILAFKIAHVLQCKPEQIFELEQNDW
jgi:putative transcriptional regulator